MGKTRVQFDFSDPALKRVDELAGITGASGRVEVVRRALQWYDWFVRLHERGTTFYVQRKKGGRTVQQVLFPDGLK